MRNPGRLETEYSETCDLCSEHVDDCKCYCEACDEYGNPDCIEHGLKVFDQFENTRGNGTAAILRRSAGSSLIKTLF